MCQRPRPQIYLRRIWWQNIHMPIPMIIYLPRLLLYRTHISIHRTLIKSRHHLLLQLQALRHLHINRIPLPVRQLIVYFGYCAGHSLVYVRVVAGRVPIAIFLLFRGAFIQPVGAVFQLTQARLILLLGVQHLRCKLSIVFYKRISKLLIIQRLVYRHWRGQK